MLMAEGGKKGTSGGLYFSASACMQASEMQRLAGQGQLIICLWPGHGHASPISMMSCDLKALSQHSCKQLLLQLPVPMTNSAAQLLHVS